MASRWHILPQEVDSLEEAVVPSPNAAVMSHFLLENLFFLNFYFMCRGSLPACVYHMCAWC